MKKTPKLKNFNAFILEGRHSQKDVAISTAVSKLKERYGNTTDKFLESVKEKGVDEIKNYVIKILEPHLNGIEAERRGLNGQFCFDFNGLLTGLVCWCLVDLELQI